MAPDSQLTLIHMRVAGLAALFCLGAALFQLYLGLPAGGVPPEAALFGALALIFGAVWWNGRERKAD